MKEYRCPLDESMCCGPEILTIAAVAVANPVIAIDCRAGRRQIWAANRDEQGVTFGTVRPARALGLFLIRVSRRQGKWSGRWDFGFAAVVAM